jgi:putative AlgH/UPF0301 family transcriptional regulator
VDAVQPARVCAAKCHRKPLGAQVHKQFPELVPRVASVRRFTPAATTDVVRAVGRGEGSRQCLLAIGHAGWGLGQLESEIEANRWLLILADPHLVLDAEGESTWRRVLAKLGISPEQLSREGERA